MIRKLEKTDDIEKVACLIYKTDASLFPFLFGKYQKATPKLKNLILLENNSFSYKHIYGSFDKKIQGILVGYRQKEINKKMEHKEFSKVFSSLELIILSIKTFILNPVIKKNQTNELYIQNISVDSGYQGKRIGTNLLEYIAGDSKNQGIDTLSIDVNTSNEKAKHLYEKMGFQIVQKNVYPFTNSGVYRMKKLI